MEEEPQVTRIGTRYLDTLTALFARYDLRVQRHPEGEIPGSYWKDTEAGLIRDTLYVRHDTPVHSALHEGCHWVCMDSARRAALHTDALGDDLEETAVCYLQALLADHLDGYARAQLFTDMDAWGYHFRLGSTQAWFTHDAEDARQWLREQALSDANDQPTFIRR